MVPNSQQTTIATADLNQADGIEGGNVYITTTVFKEKIRAGEDFKVTLENLDKEIAMFKAKITPHPKPLNSPAHLDTGPLETTLLLNPKSPLTNITNLSPSQKKPMPKASPKWTRTKRQVGSKDEPMVLSEVLGKRNAPLPLSEQKTSKSRLVDASSQKENVISAVVAGS